MIRKALSMFLIIVLILSVSDFTLSTSAKETNTQARIAKRTSDLATTGGIPENTWNDYLSIVRKDYPDYSTWYDSFDGGSECFGFAWLLGYRIFGYSPRYWNKNWDKYNIHRGDVVRTGNDAHSIFITWIDENDVYYVDCNGAAGYCVVKWDQHMTTQRLRDSFCYSWLSPGVDSSVYGAWCNINHSEIFCGDSITLNFGANNANGRYTIGIDKGNARIHTIDVNTTSYSYTLNEAGDYSAYITAYGGGTLSDSNRVYFRVVEKIPVSGAWLKIKNNSIEQGQSVTLEYGANNANGRYTIGIDKGNTRIHTIDVNTTSYSYTLNEIGDYSAYITAYGGGTLSDSNRAYFTVREKIPVTGAWLKINQTNIEQGQVVILEYGANNANGRYTIGIDKGNTRIHTIDVDTTTYSYTLNETGEYSAYITAYGGDTLSDSNRVYFTVREKLPVTGAWLKINQTTIEKGKTVFLEYGATNANGRYTIGIDKGNTRIHTIDVDTTTYSYTINEAGDYSAYITAYGGDALSDSNRVFFTVVNRIKGDVDSDGIASVVDATYIQRYNVHIQIPIEEETLIKCGDIDGDGEVTVVDATFIQRYDSKIPTPYPIGEPI